MKRVHGKRFGDESDVEVVEPIELHEEAHRPKVKRLVVFFPLFVPNRVSAGGNNEPRIEFVTIHPGV